MGLFHSSLSKEEHRGSLFSDEPSYKAEQFLWLQKSVRQLPITETLIPRNRNII